MKPHPSLLVPALAASFLIARPAVATEATELESAGTTLTGFEAEDIIEASPIVSVHPGVTSGGTLEAAVWRPRRGAPRYPAPARYPQQAKPPKPPTNIFQLHGGFYDPEGVTENDFMGGVRIAAGERIQVGIGGDWGYSTRSQIIPTGGVTLPGGGSIPQTNVELTDVNMQLVPAMGILQIVPQRARGLLPYVGAGGGYEWLFVKGTDINTGQLFDATYGGWGWQTWAGLGLSLGSGARLNAEYFWNNAKVGRDVYDASLGVVYREELTLKGNGIRAGIGFMF
jgi:hypothetical protein